MKPLRMCMVCRSRREKSDLIRLVKLSPAKAAVDKTGKASGRGAYICKNSDCINKAKKCKAFERAFSMQIDPLLYEELEQYTEDTYES